MWSPRRFRPENHQIDIVKKPLLHLVARKQLDMDHGRQGGNHAVDGVGGTGRMVQKTATVLFMGRIFPAGAH